MRDPDLTDDLARLDVALRYAPEALPHADLCRLAQAWRRRALEAEAELRALRDAAPDSLSLAP